jgi:hypothetical protein
MAERTRTQNAFAHLLSTEDFLAPAVKFIAWIFQLFSYVAIILVFQLGGVIANSSFVYDLAYALKWLLSCYVGLHVNLLIVTALKRIPSKSKDDLAETYFEIFGEKGALVMFVMLGAVFPVYAIYLCITTIEPALSQFIDKFAAAQALN